MKEWSFLRLFLYLFQPVLELLLFHTNIKGQRTNKTWKPITPLELRRWLACRLEIAFKLSEHDEMSSFWSSNSATARTLGRKRFQDIEANLSVESTEEKVYKAHYP